MNRARLASTVGSKAHAYIVPAGAFTLPALCASARHDQRLCTQLAPLLQSYRVISKPGAFLRRPVSSTNTNNLVPPVILNMHSRYSRYPLLRPPDMADPEPPQPTPFPIKIVQDPPPKLDVDEEAMPGADGKKRNDCFYPAWQKFLAIEPSRAKSTSAIVKKTADEREAVAGTEGLQIEENASTSWEQAAQQCRAKVAAIVEECERLNQKYRDAIFDLEANDYCLKSLNGSYPGVSAGLVLLVAQQPSLTQQLC